MLKRGSIIAVLLSTLMVVLFTFCDKKNDPAPVSPGPAETTKSENAGSSGVLASSGSPELNTSASTATSELTLTLNPGQESFQNTTLYVSTSLSEWTFDPCLLNPLTLQGTNGGTTVLLTFGSVIATGNYTLTSGVPLPGQVRMTVLNPPGQPTGLLFVSKSGGTVSVNVGTSTTVAAFTGVQCTPLPFLYPIVTVSGDVGCN